MPGKGETPEPAWPSDDQDSARGAGTDGVTDELPVPNATSQDQPTVWVPKLVLPPPPPRPAQQQRPLQPPRPPAPAQVPPAGTPAVPMRIEPNGEQRPAPATTGDTEPPPIADTAEADAAPKRRRGLVLSGLAVVLVIAVGVALALPYVSNRLGLPWAPNLPKGDPPQPVAATRSLSGPSDSVPPPTGGGVEAALAGPASDSALGTLTGTVIDPVGGTTLWERNASQAITPASTVKVLTAAAALLALDHGSQLSTRVVAGAEPGTVVLVAGGDVTLSSLPEGQESVYPGAAHLDDLVAQVKQATGGNVTRVQLDLSAYAGPLSAQGWAAEDAPSTYAAPVTPAMLDGGRSVADDDKSQRHAQPATVLAQELASRLGAQVGTPVTTTAPQGGQLLGEVKSAPLTELVDQFLLHSDNLLADVIARQVAIATGAEPSFAGSAQATLDVLQRNGFDISGAHLSDNSGLSLDDKVPANLFGDVLAVAAAPDGRGDARTAKLRPLLGGLPVAGGSGTLADRYTEGTAVTGRGWVRAKTGTIPSDGINTLAGVVLDKDGRVLVFAVMTSGSDTDAGRAALDTITATLRGCGCQ